MGNSLFSDLGGGLLGYFRRFLGYREFRILILGLDEAGKTTFLYRLKLGEVVTTITTCGLNLEVVTYKNTKFHLWDMDRRDKILPLHRHYYPNTDAIIWVVDSQDRDRIEMSREEFFRLTLEDDLKSAVILVLANKQDIEGCMSLSEIHQALGLDNLKNRTCQLFKISVTKGEGLEEALDWLTNALYTRK